jgi:hypothetical protein
MPPPRAAAGATMPAPSPRARTLTPRARRAAGREGSGEYDEWLCFAAGGERAGVAAGRVDAVRHCGSCTSLIEPDDAVDPDPDD